MHACTRFEWPGGLLQGFFGKVVVDAFDPSILLSMWVTHPINFETATLRDLEDFVIPLSFVCKGPATLHGVACWFDVLFPGSAQQTWLSTAPGMPPTHWFQLRCVFQVLFACFSLAFRLLFACFSLAHVLATNRHDPTRAVVIEE
jgi:hypothetical protein